MPPPPAETSRPPRRALGRGPGTPPAAPEPPPEAAGPVAAAPGRGHGEPRPVAEPPAGPAGSEDPHSTNVPGPTRPAPPGPETPGPEAVPAPEALLPEAPGSEAPGPEAVPAPEAPAARATARETAAPEVAAPGPEAPGPPAPAPDPGAAADGGRFTVRLENFEGPFDLLLQLISKHKLDVTEVALSKVTDEFMAHIRAMGADWDLDQTTEFLVVAATLLDLKAARLLPAAEVEDEADLALLEARDLLFARLLQYRAYKRIADIFGDRWEAEGRRYPRTVGLEPHHAELLPEVVISIGAEGFARLAVKAMQPKAKPQVYVDHIHAPLVSVREQAGIVVALLRERGTLAFRELTRDAPDTLTVVARFLALLELYRDRAVALDQDEALGELTVSWTGGDGETRVTDEFDEQPDHETEARA
ncbi:segregation/condensation protein A [Streptomyces sp. NPDC008121]|uniref:segregation and condensation protein A n=1 Tax=Streptomyces sp. NPDC008121 TaxID=3364809 RepID=UPI0036EDFD4F